MKRVKRCSNCCYFIKWKRDPHHEQQKRDGSALCEYYDGRTKSGNSACKHWQSIKYQRTKRYSPYITKGYNV